MNGISVGLRDIFILLHVDAFLVCPFLQQFRGGMFLFPGCDLPGTPSDTRPGNLLQFAVENGPQKAMIYQPDQLRFSIVGQKLPKVIYVIFPGFLQMPEVNHWCHF